jgi:hypothetical protein
MKKIAFLVGLLCWCDTLGFSQDQAQTQAGVININISVSRTAQPVTYPINYLAEFQLNGDKSKVTVTTQLPNLAMIVTAELYFAASYASEEVVLQGNPSAAYQGSDHAGDGTTSEPQHVP